MKVSKKQVTKQVTHPMEEFFDLEPETTISTHVERETELTDSSEYDNKDIELEESYQEILDKALTTFERLQDEVEDAEGKDVITLSDVSNRFLNTALYAAERKAKLKQHKDKLAVSRGRLPAPKTVNQTLIINREDLLKNIDNIVDAEIVEKQIEDSNSE